MLSEQDNEYLCRVGPGTPMGDLMRQYWIPAIRSDELPAPDCPPLRVHAAGRGPDRLPHDLRRGRPDAELLPAPRRLDVLRPQRGRGPALRLPRLEVRRRRQLRRHAVGAGREQLQEQGARARLPDARARRHHLGLHGPARGAAAAARHRSEHAWPTDPSAISMLHRTCNWMQGSRARSTPSTRPSCTGGADNAEDHEPGQLRLLPRTSQRDARSSSSKDTEFGTAYGAYRPAEDDSYYWRIAPRCSSRSTP